MRKMTRLWSLILPVTCPEGSGTAPVILTVPPPCLLVSCLLAPHPVQASSTSQLCNQEVFVPLPLPWIPLSPPPSGTAVNPGPHSCHCLYFVPKQI